MGYAGENPLRFVDPAGLADCGIYDNHGEYTEKTKKSVEESKKKQQAEQNYWHMQFMKFNNYGKYPDENWNEISNVIEDSIKSLINLDFGYDFSQLAANAWENGQYLTYVLAIIDSAGEKVLDCFFAYTGAENVQICITEFESFFNKLKEYYSPIDVVQQAKNWQGKGNYPGVDNWTKVTLKNGSYVWCGEPGQGYFYTTTSDMMGAGRDATKIFQGLQVSRGEFKYYRPGMTLYRVPFDMDVAISQVSANPEYGEGGFTQLYIPMYLTLTPVYTLLLENR